MSLVLQPTSRASRAGYEPAQCSQEMQHTQVLRLPVCFSSAPVQLRKSRCVVNSLQRTAGSRLSRHRTLLVEATYPEPETEKERSTIDFPQEWITPQPSRRPDIFPEFEKLETPVPKPLPGDPELPEDEEEEEKEKKEEPEKDPEEEPDKPQPPPEE